MAITPYYRTTSSFAKSNVCYEEPTFHYSSYNVFCLHTQLYPYLNNKYKNGYNITFESTTEYPNQRLMVKVNPEDNVDYAELNKEINRILSLDTVNYCLLFDSNSAVYYKTERIPQYWIKSITPYLSILDKVNPFINDGKIYVDLRRAKDFKTAYNKLVESIQRQFEYMYQRGYIVNVSADFANRWDLADIGNKLYRTRWKDYRWGPVSKLLINQWLGYNYIELRFKPSIVKLHYIIAELNKLNIDYIADIGRIRFRADNLSEARYISRLIERVSANAFGVAIVNYKDINSKIREDEVIINKLPDLIMTSKIYH